MKYDLCDLEKIVIRNKQMSASTHFVIIKHGERDFSTGILIDSPIGMGRGWYLFGQQKFQTELAVVMAFNKLVESSQIPELDCV